MRQRQRAGRPRAVSREILEEAACELFLEQGYAATSVADITQRAGVSRATFFNYVSAKSDLLWTSVDELLVRLGERLAQTDPAPGTSTETGAGDAVVSDAVASVRAALLRCAADLTPGSVVLAFANAEPMGVAEELEESAARRQRRCAEIVAAHLRRRDIPELEAEVLAAAHAGALLAAVRAWSRSPAPVRTSPAEVLGRALAVIG